MIRVRVNGMESTIRGEGFPKLADLVELVKASIDPDHMITAIRIDDRDLDDDDWSRPLAQFATATLDVETGPPEEYVARRISSASGVVRSCYLEFRDARKWFQDGDMKLGNERLKVAVTTLKAFFEWYGTLLELVPLEKRTNLDISPHVRELIESCKKITQQQLYQSWWALGESLENDLEPKLDKLEDHCRRLVRYV